MVFSSAIFLFAFLPIVFILCILPVPLKFKNAVLIIASLFFYAYGEPVYVLLMLASSIVNYIFGRLLGRSSIKETGLNLEELEVKKYVGIDETKTPYRTFLLVLAVILNIGTLGVFKYTDFILSSINNAFHSSSGNSTSHRNLVLYLPGTFLCYRCVQKSGNRAKKISGSSALYSHVPSACSRTYSKIQ